MKPIKLQHHGRIMKRGHIRLRFMLETPFEFIVVRSSQSDRRFQVRSNDKHAAKRLN